MKGKKRFYIIVLTVAILLSGLIVVQLYWIKNAYRLQGKDFNERIAAVLAKVITDTERLNSSFYLYGRTYIQPGQGITVLKPNYSGNDITDTVKLFNIFPYYYKPDTCFYSTNVSYYNAPVIADISIRFEYVNRNSKINYAEKNSALNNLNINNYRQMLNEQSPVTKRIKIKALDSVIRARLYETGIDTVFAYGLRKKGNNPFEYTSGAKDLLQKKNEQYIALLFTDIAYTTPYELVLFVRNKDAYISKSLGIALLASFSFLILLTAAFIYFISTLLRQKRISEMKTDFINNMTHEFMTPVTNIGLAIESLQKRNKTPEEEAVMLDLIAAENTHLQDNINKVLQVATLEKGSFMLDLLPLNIHDILLRVAKSFNMQMKTGKGEFVFMLQAANHIITADETHMINLFGNLLDNAIKYTTDRPPVITISTRNVGKKLLVSIEDNGPGMTDKVLKHVFDKFYRGTRRDVHDVKGFGLGLNYVKNIADAHGFTIDVKTTHGKGTIFIIGLS